MEDVGRLPPSHVGTHNPVAKKSAISLKDSAFFEYRWYKILEALHQAKEDLTLQGLVQGLKRMGMSPNETLLEDDLLRLEGQGYVESRKESDFPPVKIFRLTPLGKEKVKRVLRKL
ncbi:MAG: helix-turn-helix transcriptional regulator [Thermoplasmata archaeon]|nr:helix-turn-helix transcriptional regulator [Thermoplasmata archaeon]